MPEDAAGAELDIQFPPFRPRWPWRGGDLQTLRNKLLEAVGVPPADLSRYPSEDLRLPMRDGTGDALVAMLGRPETATGHPLVILIHGLTGCADSLYLRATAGHLLALGYPVLRLNLRGAGLSRPLCTRHYHAGRSGDIRAALAALDPALTAHGVVIVGYSMGGNMLLKYLGEEGAAAPVLGAASISAPIDLAATARRMLEPRNSLYQRWLLRNMKRESLQGPAQVSPEERRRTLQARTVYEFDDVFIAPRNGFGTADTYYAICSGRQFLPAIAVPTLVIHAQDDPWIPAEPYLTFPWRSNRKLTALIPDSGGHVGFHDTGGPPAWHDRCLARFLARLIGVPVPQD